MRHLISADVRYVCGHCRWPIPVPPDRWRGRLVLSCASRTSQGCGKAAIDYGLFPARLISYWDECLEHWEAIEVLDGKHRRASEAKRVERRVMKGRA